MIDQDGKHVSSIKDADVLHTEVHSLCNVYSAEHS